MEQQAVIGEEAEILMRGCKSRKEIDHLVRRGRQLRAAALAAFGERIAEFWRIFFPGSRQRMLQKEKAI